MHHVFLNCFVHLLNVVIRIFRVWKVHTHQFDVLTVYQDRGGDGSLVDVFSVNDSFSPLSVPHDPNSVFIMRCCLPLSSGQTPPILQNRCSKLNLFRISSYSEC